MFLENNHLIWFDKRKLVILINLSLPAPGICQFDLSTFWSKVRRRFDVRHDEN